MLNDSYSYVRVRWVILIWIASEVFVELLGGALWPDWRSSDLKPDTLKREVFRLTSYGFSLFLQWFIWGHHFNLKKIFGTLPNHREAWIYLSLSIPILGLHYVGTYLLYLPLSYVVPAFVAWRLPRVKSPAFIRTDLVNLISANRLKDFGTVVVAPIVEEIVFRGLISPSVVCKIRRKTSGCAIVNIVRHTAHRNTWKDCEFGHRERSLSPY